MYAINNKFSFAQSAYWVDEVKRNTNKDSILVLVGNKLDLAFNRKVNFLDAKLFSERKNLIFYESSAKVNINVDQVFLDVVKRLTNEDFSRKYDREVVELEQKNKVGFEKKARIAVRFRFKK